MKFSSINDGIAETINKCAKISRGRYVGVLDHEDLTEPHAIGEYAKLLENQPHADLIYCDEDEIDLDGNFIEPWHKSDWNSDLALCFNYAMPFGF